MLKERGKPVVSKIRPDNLTGALAMKPLTADELTAVTVNFKRKGALNINTQKSIRGEMIRVYDMVTRAELPLTAGMKLMYMLAQISRSRLEEEKLEILRRGGIQGEQFIGLIIEAPP